MSDEEIQNNDGNRLFGYQTAFSGNINDFRDFLYWFKQEEEYENEIRLREEKIFQLENQLRDRDVSLDHSKILSENSQNVINKNSFLRKEFLLNRDQIPFDLPGLYNFNI
jgi:hypothetical protein